MPLWNSEQVCLFISKNLLALQDDNEDHTSQDHPVEYPHSDQKLGLEPATLMTLCAYHRHWFVIDTCATINAVYIARPALPGPTCLVGNNNIAEVICVCCRSVLDVVVGRQFHLANLKCHCNTHFWINHRSWPLSLPTRLSLFHHREIIPAPLFRLFSILICLFVYHIFTLDFSSHLIECHRVSEEVRCRNRNARGLFPSLRWRPDQLLGHFSVCPRPCFIFNRHAQLHPAKLGRQRG